MTDRNGFVFDESDRELALILQQSFASLCEDREMDRRVAESVTGRMNRRSFSHGVRRGVAAVAVACVALVAVVAGGGFVASPAGAISLDSEGSVKLVVNRFNTVVGVEYYNDSGESMTSDMDLEGMDCGEAVALILKNENDETARKNAGAGAASDGGSEEQVTASVQGQPAVMDICVAGAGSMTDTVQAAVDENSSRTECLRISVSSLEEKERKEADRRNISYGRYKIYLRLVSMGCDVPLDQVRKTSMDQLYAMLDEAMGKDTEDQQETGSAEVQLPDYENGRTEQASGTENKDENSPVTDENPATLPDVPEGTENPSEPENGDSVENGGEMSGEGNLDIDYANPGEGEDAGSGTDDSAEDLQDDTDENAADATDSVI